MHRVQNLVTVFEDDSLIHAYEKVLLHRISALPVISRTTGELMAVLSATDLKGITKTNFFKLEAAINRLLPTVEKVPLPFLFPFASPTDGRFLSSYPPAASGLLLRNCLHQRDHFLDGSHRSPPYLHCG